MRGKISRWANRLVYSAGANADKKDAMIASD
jgi:hypothetical protein